MPCVILRGRHEKSVSSRQVSCVLVEFECTYAFANSLDFCDLGAIIGKDLRAEGTLSCVMFCCQKTDLCFGSEEWEEERLCAYRQYS